jgi:predicted CoA-binding protein
MTSGLMHSDRDAIRKLLASKVWAMIGLTDAPGRTVYQMATLLSGHGVRVVPINPRADAVLGEPGFKNVTDIPFQVDVVAIYRRSEFVAPHFDEAIQIGASGVWTPLDVQDDVAAERAIKAGLTVVMDRCPAIEWPANGPR